MDFAWKPTSSLGRWLGMLVVIAIVCVLNFPVVAIEKVCQIECFFKKKFGHSMFFYEKLNGHQFSFQFLLAELNTFYLKFVLWIPPPHFLCLGRLVFFVFMGACAMREGFQYMDDP